MKNELISKFSKLKEDFELYSRLNLKLKNKVGKLVPFHFWNSQRYLWNLWQEDVAAGKPIRWYCVKSRQEGNSKFFLALYYWLCTMNSNRNAILVSHDQASSYNMLATMQNFYMRSERVLRPSVRKMNRQELHFAASIEDFEKTGEIGLDSYILSQTADTEMLARSYTFQYAHLSEFAMWPELGIDIYDRLQSLHNAIPDEPGTAIIIETTAMGENQAYEFWNDDSNGFRKIFIPRVANEEYRIALPTHDFEFELNDNPESKYGDEKQEFNNLREELIIWYPHKGFGRMDNIDKLTHEIYCRLAWRRYAIDTRSGGNKFRFKQEYPTKVMDAFLSSSKSVFSPERVAEMDQYIDSRNIKPKKYRYHHDDDIDNHTRKFYEAPYGTLEIFDYPDVESTYIIGGDGAQGIKDGDQSALYVLKLPHLEEAASFADIISPDQFAGVANYLGLYYNTGLLGLEVNDKGGYAAVEKLVNFYKYPNLYYSVDLLAKKRVGSVRYGFYTNQITRQVMITDLNSLIANGDIFIKSKRLISQLKTFVELPNGKLGAMFGKKDDMVVAAMIAVQVAKQAHIKRFSKPARAPKYSVEWWLKNQRKGFEQEKFRRA